MMFVTPNSTKLGNNRQQPESKIIRNAPPGLHHYWDTEPSLISENNPTRQLRPNLMVPKLILNPGEPFEKRERKCT
jgi:hypothetical protein